MESKGIRLSVAIAAILFMLLIAVYLGVRLDTWEAAAQFTGPTGGVPSFFGFINLTAPPLTGWTADNCGSCTFDTSIAGELYLIVPKSGVVSIGAQYRTAPATPYSIKALMLHDFSGISPGNGATFTDAGPFLVFRDGTGKYVAYAYNTNSSGGAYSVSTEKWTAATTFSAAYKTQASSIGIGDTLFANPAWMCITDDGTTNLTFRWSIDGRHWQLYDTRARTDFLAAGPTQVGIAAFTDLADVQMAILSWQVTANATCT